MTDYKKWKKKKERYDAITVMAMLAIVVLSGAACAWIQSNPEKVSEVVGHYSTNSDKDKEEAKATSRKIIVSISIISFVIVVIFIISMINRKREQAKIIRKIEEERRKLQEAKARVEQAKLEALMNAGRSELNKRNTNDYIKELDDDYIEDLISKRRRHYDMEDKVFEDNLDFLDNFDLDEYNDFLENLSLKERIIKKIKTIYKNIKKIFTRKGI